MRKGEREREKRELPYSEERIGTLCVFRRFEWAEWHRRTHFPIANYRGYASASVANACAIAYTRDTLIHDGSIRARER